MNWKLENSDTSLPLANFLWGKLACEFTADKGLNLLNFLLTSAALGHMTPVEVSPRIPTEPSSPPHSSSSTSSSESRVVSESCSVTNSVPSTPKTLDNVSGKQTLFYYC